MALSRHPTLIRFLCESRMQTHFSTFKHIHITWDYEILSHFFGGALRSLLRSLWASTVVHSSLVYWMISKGDKQRIILNYYHCGLRGIVSPLLGSAKKTMSKLSILLKSAGWFQRGINRIIIWDYEALSHLFLCVLRSLWASSTLLISLLDSFKGE
jgi:hypothetical protein